MTLCPGKMQVGAMSGHWKRDLAADLDVVKSFGAVALVTLMEESELTAVGLSKAAMEAATTSRSIGWHHVPIRDGGVPDAAFEDCWSRVEPSMLRQLRSGDNTVIHCLGGLGRTGLVAARLLVQLGVGPPESIALVRAARPGTIENQSQERYVLEQQW